MTSLYIYYILTLIMIFCYIVVVSFLKYISIWFIFFQSIFSVVLFLSLFIKLKLKRDNFCDNKSKSFILLYSMSEIFINLFFILSYVLGYITLSINILLFFKLGVIPVLFYKFLVGCLNYGYIYSRISVCLYFVLSKLWVLVILSKFHMDSVTFLFLIIWSFYLILSTSIFSWDYKGFIFKSFIFSNLLVIFWGYICGVFLFIYGVIITGLFQFKLLYFLKEETSIENIVCSSFILTLLNGSPIFFFNFLKLYIISSLINISFLGLFLFSFLSSVFLCYSLYIFFTQTKFSFITIFSSFLKGFVSILFISLLFWFFLLFFLSSFDYVTITEGSSFVTIFLKYSNILNIRYFLEEGLRTDKR
uniref:hypothetical protein n=1 Tax=Thelohanellus kitauei TaxID=669202 RepID=UPI003002D680